MTEKGPMFRNRIRQQVMYGHFKEFVDMTTELNVLLRERGLAEFTTWAPSFGTANDVVLEAEYPDLASYQRETDAFHSDPELMKVWRRDDPIVVQGSIIIEIFEHAPDLA
jgi:hypothetical protein